MLYASSLLKKFHMTSLMFLRKSHTHDIIGQEFVRGETYCMMRLATIMPRSHFLPDQLWGILARKLANEDKLYCPDGVAERILGILTSPAVRNWIGRTTEIHVSILRVVRDWRAHLSALKVGLQGGMLRDSEANHMYVFMPRRGPYKLLAVCMLF